MAHQLEEILITDHTGRQTFNRHLLHYIWEQNEVFIEPFSTKIYDESCSTIVDAFGRTLLHYAVEYVNGPVAQSLINSGYDMHAVDNLGQTPLHLALEKKDVKLLHMLACKVSEIYVDEGIGRKWLRVLLDGPEWIAVAAAALFPKMKVKSGDIAELAEILLDEKCDLCYAIFVGNAAVTRIMLDKGSSIEAKDAKGNTALHYAVRAGHIENVKLLLERGANVNAQNVKGAIPLNHRKTLFTTAEHREILKLLVRHGSDSSTTEIVDPRMQCYHVFRKGTKEAVEILLNPNTIFLARDGRGRTGLHYLTLNTNPGVFELLIPRKINTNGWDEVGITALHLAAREQNVVACKILLDKGADVNAVANNSLGVPLFYAIKFTKSDKNKQCVELLLERGADAQFMNMSGFTIFAGVSKSLPQLIGVLLGHFAWIATFGTAIIDQIREHIEENDHLKSHYDLCRDRLETLIKEQFYRDITLFTLLTEDVKKVAGYMRIEELLAKAKSFQTKFHFNPYCKNKIEKHINDAIQLAELMEQAALVLYKIIDSIVAFNTYVVHEIICYLDRRDLENVMNL